MSCCAGFLLSRVSGCFNSAVYNVCCRPCGISSSKATRIAYAIVFLLFVILARLMLIDQAKIFLLKIKPLTEGKLLYI
jgi:hypothetical protein